MVTVTVTVLDLKHEKCVCVCVCRLQLPYASNSVFAGYELGSVRLWSEEFGFSVLIDPTHNIQITLSKRHQNRTCGLCGNYNSASSDEYAAQEGKSSPLGGHGWSFSLD